MAVADQELVQLMQKLDAAGCKNFDPARFAYVRSMLQRAQQHPFKGNAAISKKAHHNAVQYLRDFASRQARARQTLERLEQHFPPQSGTAQALFERAEFAQLNRLHRRLCQHQGNAAKLATLRELVASTGDHESGAAGIAESPSLAELLANQEQSKQWPAARLAQAPDPASTLPALRALKKFRASVSQHNTDKIITRALTEFPENPGPHNPHMLAIKALSKMRNLSPPYLRRLAGFIETLTWLEKAAAKQRKKPS